MPDHDFLPADGDSSTNHVGSYRRRLPVSLERMYENALDWEHLPHLHNSSFTKIDCVDAGTWGWRATVIDVNGQVNELELKLDRSRRRWITSNLSGPNEGAEIWTLVSPLGPHELEIVVDFFVPDVPLESREKLGRVYASVYTQLYDEDERMMVARQQAIDGRAGASTSAVGDLSIGALEALESGSVVTYRGRDYVLRCLAEDSVHATLDDWVVYPRLCPHQLGPLDEGDVVDGVVSCPWHGYKFDVRTGENLTGHACKLSPLPTLDLNKGMLVIS
ncbi:MAG: Rieske (2Fe-2S) protein [Pseudomonadota bacterium]